MNDHLSQNNSSQDNQTLLSPEIKKWNWGAFFFNWIWGIFNNVYFSLWVFFPIFGLAVPFILGAKGNRWAWKNKKWRDLAHFQKTQRNWSLAGIIIFVVSVLATLFFTLVVILTLLFVTHLLKKSEPYRLGQQKLQESTIIQREVGIPFVSSWVRGSIKTNAAWGNARLSFTINGPKGKAKVYLEAIEERDQWQLIYLAVEIQNTSEVRVLVEENNPSESTPHRCPQKKIQSEERPSVPYEAYERTG